MRLGPIHAVDFRFSNGLVIYALHLDRYGQPLQTLQGLDPVSVPPVPFCVLHIIIQYKLIREINQIKTTLPWNVIGLENSDFFNHNFKEFLTEFTEKNYYFKSKVLPIVKTKNRVF